MKIAICFDNTISLPVRAIADLFKELCPTLKCKVIDKPIRIDEDALSYETFPKYFESASIKSDALDAAFLFTTVRYENNFFYESTDNRFAVSLSEWNLLTDLPIANGIVYFIACILIRDILGVGERHMERNTGCTSDMLIDKRGVDLAMRAAYVCSPCLATRKLTVAEQTSLKELQKVLDAVSSSSRTGTDIFASATTIKGKNAKKFDVFLCHNSKDKPYIRKINQRLKNEGVATWFDEEQLKPGRLWQPVLEKQIAKIANALVFVGPSGVGPWEGMEVRAFLDQFAKRGCPVIPVILPTAKKIPKLPLFLSSLQYVDLRKREAEGLAQIVGALER